MLWSGMPGTEHYMRVAAVTLQLKYIVSASTRSVRRAAGAPFPEGVFRDLARAVSSLPAASISVTAMEPSELPLHTCIDHAYLKIEFNLVLAASINSWHDVTSSTTGKLVIAEAVPAAEIFKCSWIPSDNKQSSNIVYVLPKIAYLVDSSSLSDGKAVN